jgi:hypothetical protein
MFLDAMLARAPTTLINPEITVGSPEERIYRLDYAFRACLHAVTVRHSTVLLTLSHVATAFVHDMGSCSRRV